MFLRIAFIVDSKVKILAVLALLSKLDPDQDLALCQYIEHLIALGCLFVIKLLHKLPTTFSHLAIILMAHLLQSANIGLLAGLKPIRSTQLLKKNRLNSSDSKT